MTTIATELLDLRYVLAVTAASKHEGEDGSVAVDVHLDVAVTDVLKPQQAGGSGCETIALRLSLPQFYQLLSTMEEARAALVKGTD
jgi:hypothetical protein